MKLRLIFAALALVCASYGQRLVASVSLPDTLGYLSYPDQLIPNPATGRVYVANGTGTLVFDPATMAKVRRYGQTGLSLDCPEAGRLLVFRDSVDVFDANADTWLRTVPVLFRAAQAVYSRTSNRVYLTSEEDRYPVLVFDPLADSVVNAVNTGSVNTSLAWDSVNNRIYVGLRSHLGRLAVIDCAGDSIIGYVGTGVSEPVSLTSAPGSRKVYCSGALDSASAPALVAVSTDSLQAVAVIPGVPVFEQMRYSPFTNRLYASDADTLYSVDCATDTVRTRLATEPVYDLACSPLTGKVYVAREESTLAVLDTSDAVVAELVLPGAGGASPRALAFSVQRNELYCALYTNLVYVFDAGADTLRGVVDYSNYRVYNLISNPGADKLYVFCAGLDVVLVLDREFRPIARIPRGVTDAHAIPVLHPLLNRLYVGDAQWVRIIDCNTDVLLDSLSIAGISDPLPVLVPDLNKLYVFPKNATSSGRRIWVYDLLRNSLIDTIWLGHETPCAVYQPGTNKLYFAQDGAQAAVLDVTRDTILRTLSAPSASTHSRMLANSLNNRVYFANGRTNLLYTIDVEDDSVLGSMYVTSDLDSIFWNRRLNRLYLAANGHSTLVYDCAAGQVVDTITASLHYCGLMNERNDKLYLGTSSGIVVYDCRYDSLIATLYEIHSPRAVDWNPARNLMYFARRANAVVVYEDDLVGFAEEPLVEKPLRFLVVPNPLRTGVATVRWDMTQFGSADRGRVPSRVTVYDATGRLVYSSVVPRASSFPLDLRSVRAGVYLVRLTVGGFSATQKLIISR